MRKEKYVPALLFQHILTTSPEPSSLYLHVGMIPRRFLPTAHQLEVSCINDFSVLRYFSLVKQSLWRFETLQFGILEPPTSA
jgi:hypothetical protein